MKQLSKGLEKKGLPVETTGINFFTDASILVEHKLDAAVLLNLVRARQAWRISQMSGSR